MEAGLGLGLATLGRLEVAAGLSAAVAGPLWALAADAQVLASPRR